MRAAGESLLATGQAVAEKRSRPQCSATRVKNSCARESYASSTIALNSALFADSNERETNSRVSSLRAKRIAHEANGSRAFEGSKSVPSCLRLSKKIHTLVKSHNQKKLAWRWSCLRM